MSDSEDFSDIDCDHVLTGATGRVLMAKVVTADFVQLESKKQARLISNAKLWADGLNPHSDQFQGNEGRCGGANDRMLVAVKVHKVRLYGFIRRIENMKTLIIVEIDSAKKQDKASPRMLRKAKSAVIDMDVICGD